MLLIWAFIYTAKLFGLLRLVKSAIFLVEMYIYINMWSNAWLLLLHFITESDHIQRIVWLCLKVENPNITTYFVLAWHGCQRFHVLREIYTSQSINQVRIKCNQPREQIIPVQTESQTNPNLFTNQPVVVPIPRRLSIGISIWDVIRKQTASVK